LDVKLYALAQFVEFFNRICVPFHRKNLTTGGNCDILYSIAGRALPMPQTNRNYKDSVFRMIFNDEREALGIYNSVGELDYPPDTTVKIVTLDDVLFKEQKNDLAFIIDNRLIVLTEHASTFTQNYPVRFLMYIAREYEKLIDRKDVYKEKLIKLPAPEFIVLYNGIAEQPDKQVLRLSEAFDIGEGEHFGKNALELTVRVVNINKGRNSKLVKKSKTLVAYVEFIAKARYYEAEQNLPRAKAVSEAVKYCINNGILVDFLQKHGSEVNNMLFTEWNWEEAMEVRAEEAAEDAREQITRTAVVKLKREKTPDEVIARAFSLPIEQVRAIHA
jgi:hypothetical protein